MRVANQAGRFGVPQQRGPRNQGPGRFTGDCRNCGNISLHAYTEDGSCPARNLTCYNCRRVGHMSRVCRSRGPLGPPGPQGPPQGGANQA